MELIQNTFQTLHVKIILKKSLPKKAVAKRQVTLMSLLLIGQMQITKSLMILKILLGHSLQSIQS